MVGSKIRAIGEPPVVNKISFEHGLPPGISEYVQGTTWRHLGISTIWNGLQTTLYQGFKCNKVY